MNTEVHRKRKNRINKLWQHKSSK